MEFCQNDSDLHKTTQKTRDWGKKQTNTQYMQVSFVLHKLLTKVAPMCFQQQQQKQSQSLKIQLPFLFSPSKFWEESNHHPSHPRTQMRLPGFCGSQSAKCLSESHDTFRRFVRMPVWPRQTCREVKSSSNKRQKPEEYAMYIIYICHFCEGTWFRATRMLPIYYQYTTPYGQQPTNYLSIRLICPWRSSNLILIYSLYLIYPHQEKNTCCHL